MALVSERFLKRQDIALLVALMLTGLVLLLLPAGAKLSLGSFTVRVFFAPLELPLYQSRSLVTAWRENAELRDQLVRLRLENIALTSARRDNDQLRSLLALGDRAGWTLLSAQIIGREPALLTPDLIINRGSSSGLSRGMVAIAPQGLVGKITDVGAATATVRTVFDPQSRVSAIDLRSRVLGVFRSMRGSQCLFDMVPVRTDVRPGDTVVTSGYGQMFPFGLMLGIVDRVETNKRSLIYQITVRPALDINTLSYVSVVTGGAVPSLPSLAAPAMPDSSGQGAARRRRTSVLSRALKLQLPQLRMEIPDTIQLTPERPR
jgi:rod shape-determining protein MreC